MNNSNIKELGNVSFDDLCQEYYVHSSQAALREILSRFEINFANNIKWHANASMSRFISKNLMFNEIIDNTSALIKNNSMNTPIPNDLFQIFTRIIYTSRNHSDYILDYISDQQLIRLVSFLTVEQIRELKLHYIKNYPNYVTTFTIIIGAALDKTYSTEDFYSDIPGEYQLGIFV